MANQHFTIDIKHDTAHRKWKRLSVVTLSPKALEPQLYVAQIAKDKQLNADQIAWRVVEIESHDIGTTQSDRFIRIVDSSPSAATTNRPN